MVSTGKLIIFIIILDKKDAIKKKERLGNFLVLFE